MTLETGIFKMSERIVETRNTPEINAIEGNVFLMLFLDFIADVLLPLAYWSKVLKKS